MQLTGKAALISGAGGGICRAIAVAYADLVLVTTTIMNQSGQSVTGITMIMLTYLAISLLLSAFINLVNRRFQLVTR